jgi:glycosyltransferase involved in cell wall biosynthesis
LGAAKTWKIDISNAAFTVSHCDRENTNPVPASMKVGFDGRWYGHSGVGNYVSELLQAMATVGGDMEIILYEDPKNPLEHVHGERIRKVPVHAKRYSAQEQFELARRCHTDRLDVFHSPFYVAPWFASCPVVVTIHDLIPFLFNIYILPKRQLIRFGYRLAAKKAARVIVDSENTRRDLNRILGVSGKKITVVHLATSRDRYHPNPGAGEREYLLTRYGIRQPYVLTLSAKNWRTKNLSAVLKAIAICQQEIGFNFQIVIAGPPDGFHEASQQNTVARENLVLTGFVPAADLPKLYRGADVFMLGSKYEGFGLPLLEAMSCGCAVVCSNGGSLAEVAGAGAVLADPENPVQMARVTVQLLSDPSERAQLKARALKRAADFSWEEAARQTICVYSEAAIQK